MSFDGIRVDHGALDQASTDLRAAATKIDSRLNQLEDELKPLRSDWTGHAQQAYHAAKATWDQAIQEMIVLLNDVSTAVSTSNTEYKAADSRGAGRFS